MNFNKYVAQNIPFVLGGRSADGLDCWGLVQLFYKEQMGIAVPDYQGIAAGISTKQAIATIARERDLHWELTKEPKDGDVVLARMKNHPLHVGIYKDPGQMLHIEDGAHVTIEPITGIRWKKRLLGIYRLKIFQ